MKGLQTVYLIYDDSRHTYFIRIGLGIFWECGPREMAKEFTSRALAVKTMQKSGKHRLGWRVISDRKRTTALEGATV